MELEKIKNANTKNIGKEIEYFREISSTHTYAKQIALQEKHSGKMIIAETQTNGIGTKGRAWYTGESKNIAIWIKKSDNSKEIIESLLNNKEKISIMKENTKILARPNSTKDICDILFKN